MAIDDSLERARLHPDVLKNLNKNKKLKTAEAYSEDNPPPYPVTSINGQTGDVDIPTVNLPVSVQNGGTGAITVRDAPFVRKVYSANDVYVSADYDHNQVITLWQANADNTQRYGLVISKTFIGLWDNNAAGWVWRTPLMSQSLGAWQIEQGGTGGTTASAARTNLNVPSVSDLTAAQSYTINGVYFIFRRYGKVVVCTTDGSVTNAVTSSAYMGSTTVADAYKPISSEIRYVTVTPVATIQFNLSTNGTFQVGYAYPEIAAGVALRGTFVYIAAG